MPIAQHPKETRDYILMAEREKPDATVFVLGFIPQWKFAPLNRRTLDAFTPLKDGEAAKLGTVEVPADGNLPRSQYDPSKERELIPDVLRAGLRGWRNFRYADGSEAKFEANAEGEPTAASLAIIGRDGPVAMELMHEIFRINRLSGSESGN